MSNDEIKEIRQIVRRIDDRQQMSLKTIMFLWFLIGVMAGWIAGAAVGVYVL